MPDQPDHRTHWPYGSDLPQRFSENHARYRAAGGLAELASDAAAFAAGGNTGDISRFLFFCMAFDQIRKEDVGGDVAELGVYRGNTAAVLARFARRLGRTTYLLDTFSGFDSKDFRGPDLHQVPAFGDTSLAAVRAFVGEEDVQYVVGHFPDSAVALPETTYCLVHLDCDLFEPMSAGLAYFYPRLAPGGYLIVHDYGSLAWPGAERAVDTFFADKPECPIPLTDGAGSVVIRKARSGNWLTQRRVRTLFADWAEASALFAIGALEAGWSVVEDWGIWGVGATHDFLLFQSDPVASVVLELDVQVACLEADEAREVAVDVPGVASVRWGFSAADNRRVRSVTVPAAAFAPGAEGIAFARLRFHASRTVIPAEAVAGAADTRPLGMGVLRARAHRA